MLGTRRIRPADGGSGVARKRSEEGRHQGRLRLRPAQERKRTRVVPQSTGWSRHSAERHRRVPQAVCGQGGLPLGLGHAGPQQPPACSVSLRGWRRGCRDLALVGLQLELPQPRAPLQQELAPLAL